MKRTKEIKLNALRAEIQRLRGVAFDAKMEAAAHIEGAAEAIELTEHVIVAVLKKCGIDSIEIIPDMADETELMLDKTEQGFIVRLATESDKDCKDSGVE